MPTVKCFHCGVQADPEASAGYCDECGKKLPQVQQASARTEPVRSGARVRLLAELEKQGSPERSVRLTGLLILLAGLLFAGLLLMAAWHRGTAETLGEPTSWVRSVVIGLLVFCLILALFGLFLLVRGRAPADE